MVEHSELNGQAWVRQVVAGEGALLRYARRLTGCGELARDVVQETLLRCWGEERWRENGHAKRPAVAALAGEPPVAPTERHLANWLFAVCRSRAIDLLRKERRMTQVAELEDEAIGSGQKAEGSLLTAQGGRDSPAEIVEGRDSAAAAMRVLEGLPVRQQEVVVLKFQAGMSYAEIAEVTGLSVGNVGFLMHVALRAMRERMGA